MRFPRLFLNHLIMILAIVLAGLSAGCGQGFQATTSGSEVLLPWPNASGEYRFQWVRLETLSSPMKVAGPAAEVYWQAGVRDAGFIGKIVRPHVSRHRNRWIPTDVQSAQALAAYAIAEQLMLFDKSLGIESRISWPRQLGLDIRVKTQNGKVLNNAIYDVASDLIAITQYNSSSESSGLPTSLNHGIIAHEHFHAHFSAAWGSLQQSLHSAIKDGSKLAVLNRVMVSGWNEGIADFYAFVFTGDANFLRSSFDGSREYRALNGNLYASVTWAQLDQEIKCGIFCRLKQQDRDFLYYNGTSLARWFYNWGKRLNPTTGQTVLLSEIVRVLPEVLEQIRPKLDSEKISTDIFVQLLMAKQTLPVPADTCADLKSLLPLSKLVGIKGCL